MMVFKPLLESEPVGCQGKHRQTRTDKGTHANSDYCFSFACLRNTA